MTSTRSTKLLLLAALAMSPGCAAAAQHNATPTKGLVLLPPELELDLALAAAPAHLRSAASVYIFGTTGYQQVRSGTNGLTCLVNRDGHQHGGNELRPTCWDAEGSATIVPVMLRVGEMIAQGATAESIALEIDAGFVSRRFISPRKTGIAYMLRGDVVFDAKTQRIGRTIFPPHYMIYAPGITNADIGMTGAAYEGDPSLPIVYDGYTGGAHTAYVIIVAADSAAAGRR